MDLHLKLQGQRDLAEQIVSQIRAAIVEGRLPNGHRLPASRELATRLGVSRNTVTLAYERLAARGLVTSHAGSGSYVEYTERGAPKPLRAAAATLPTRPIWSELDRSFGRQPAGAFDLRPGVPDARAFPHSTWRRLVARELRADRFGGRYGDPDGDAQLRSAIVGQIVVSRGVSARPEDVVVTHGAQHGIDLVARVVVQDGMKVGVEDPGYPPVRSLLRAHGADVVGVPVDGEGIDPARIPEGVQVVYVTPAHHYPTGVPMSVTRRKALLAWAEKRDALIIEDDYDSEFRFRGRPIETLQAVDRSQRVVYVGTFSKTMLPGVRLGFLVVPESLREPIIVAQFVTAGFCQSPAQGALANFLSEGWFARHVRKRRRAYEERHDCLVKLLRRDFREWLDPIESTAGMHVCATMRGTIDEELRVFELAARRSISMHRLSPYYAYSAPLAGFVFGYGAISAHRIETAMRRLRECFVDVLGR